MATTEQPRPDPAEIPQLFADIAQKAEQTRKQRRATDGGDIAGERH